MLRVGLTGSIAVGKSFVASVLAELGCLVLDADMIAREVVAPNSLGLRAVVENFGVDVVRADGTLDRKRLGGVIFGDPDKRELLNAILHPLIVSAQDAQLDSLARAHPQGVAIVEAALMIESGGYRRFDKLIVVHCRPEIQLARLMNRNRITQTEAEARASAQMSQDEKRTYADYLIDSSLGIDETRRQIRDVYCALREDEKNLRDKETLTLV
ncbi:MAG: dephospho-CoA kinase [Pyrinomonadaceae bacterium]|nr:dephospho-CoA kinase [Pyrinomonadaceae bacterium]